MCVTDKELIDYASEFRRAIIGDAPGAWWCAGISAPLHAVLTALGVAADIVKSDLGHCAHVFIRFPDGRVLDPTAEQFNWCSRVQLPAVYLGPPSDIHQNVDEYGGQCWGELMQQCKRLYPEFGANETGKMVRMVLETFDVFDDASAFRRASEVFRFIQPSASFELVGH
jgi:hypothetical protein